MKNKYHNELKILNYITSTDKYKAIFLLTVILCLYGGFALGTSKNNFFDSILVPLQFPIFNVFLFAIIFLNNINTCSIFKNNFPDYVIRLKSKKRYIKTLLRLSTTMFLFHFGLILLFLIMPLLLTTFNDLSIHAYQNYEISNLVFLLFYILRYAIYGTLITIISTLIFINTNSKITIVINGLFLLLLFYFGGIIAYQTNVSLSIWSYFTITLYSTFSLEVFSSVCTLLLLEIIIGILYILTIKNRKLAIT